VLGVRGWQARTNGRLCSIDAPATWVAGVNQARCLRDADPEHLAPDADCACGIYGYSDLNHRRDGYFDSNVVVGTIAAWGRMEPCCDGFRAGQARILAIGCDHQSTRWQRVAARRYDVPLVRFAELERHGRQYALPWDQQAPETLGAVILVIDCGPGSARLMDEIADGCLGLLRQLQRPAHVVACGQSAQVLPNAIDPLRQALEAPEMLASSSRGPALARGLERARGRVLWAHRRWSIDVVLIATEPLDTETRLQLCRAREDGVRVITVAPLAAGEDAWVGAMGEHIEIPTDPSGVLAGAIRHVAGRLGEPRRDLHEATRTRRWVAQRSGLL